MVGIFEDALVVETSNDDMKPQSNIAGNPSEADAGSLKNESEFSNFHIFVTSRPKHIVQGTYNAVKNIFIGIFVGGLASIYMPFESTYSSYMESKRDLSLSTLSLTLIGLAKGLGLSLLVGIIAPLSGILTGAFAFIRGAINTPYALMNTFWDDTIWNNTTKLWEYYFLDVEIEQMLSVTEEEYIKQLTKNSEAFKQSANSSGVDKNRKIKEKGLYDLLEVDVHATPAEIKKRYYIQAKKYHPDKNTSGNLEDAKLKFQKISEAYQILSDPKVRQKYDLLGKEAVNQEQQFDASKLDPVLLFSFIFGSDKFVGLIGELYYSMLVTAAASSSEAAAGGDFSDMEKIFLGGDEKYSEVLNYKQKRRAVQCAKNLMEKIDSDFFDEEALVAEAIELTKDGLGKILLDFVGFVYLSESEFYLQSLNWTLRGRDRWQLGLNAPLFLLSCLRSKAAPSLNTLILHIQFYWTITKLGSKFIYQLIRTRIKRYFKNRRNGTISSENDKEDEEEIKGLLWKFKDLGLLYMWRSSILDVNSTLRETIQKVLLDKSTSLEHRKNRAKVISRIGKVYCSRSQGSSSLLLWKPPGSVLSEMQTKFATTFGDADHADVTKSESEYNVRKEPRERVIFSAAELRKLKSSQLKEMLRNLREQFPSNTPHKSSTMESFIDKEELISEIMRLYPKG